MHGIAAHESVYRRLYGIIVAEPCIEYFIDINFLNIIAVLYYYRENTLILSCCYYSLNLIYRPKVCFLS